MIPQSLAHYRILGNLGAGGMGEVYRAEDTKLKRQVAIKVLPDTFARDAKRMRRFEREAQVLASLNHPNIAAIHGLEEANGQRFLVLELAEGEDLAERLRRGAIPMDEAIPIARQIAEGLEQAHEKGIIHRDLKPSNVKLSREGVVKILDFGLAKALGDNVGGGDPSRSPTFSRPATAAGVILGTAAYMSPEQARGRTVDRRADIWAFGVVLYEMLTGVRLFQGTTETDTLASVLTTDIDFGVLPGAGIRSLLRRCLERDPKRRLQAIGEARIQLEDLLTGVADTENVAPRAARRTWVLALLGFALAALALWASWRRPDLPARLVRTSIELGSDASLAMNGTGPAIALSPDGTLLGFIGKDGAGESSKIYLRRLDQLQAFPLSGTDGAQSLFFSPDGEWIAFFTSGKLEKIPVGGGPRVTLSDVSEPRGGSWSDDGTVIFTAFSRPNVGLTRVPSTGGAAEILTKPDRAESFHRWPQALPGGKAVLFTAARATDYDRATLVVRSVADGRQKVVLRGGYHGRYLGSGYLIYVRESTLYAVPFDLARLETTGAAIPVVEDISTDTVTGVAQFAFSSGALVYVPGSSTRSLSIQWLDRQGKETPLPVTPGPYQGISISPDGQRIGMDVSDGHQWDVWVYEWTRNVMIRRTFPPDNDNFVVWSPDGSRIAFRSFRDDSVGNLYWGRADGTGEPTRLTESENLQLPSSWHPNGRDLAFLEFSPQTNYDIMILPIEGDEDSGFRVGPPTAFLNSPFGEWHAAFSPDGRFMAYGSNESGRPEVYVLSYPTAGRRWQISTGGGGWPTWSRNGRELFYRTLDKTLMVVPYSVRGDSFEVGKPRLWSETQVLSESGFPRPFDLHPDGERVAVLVPEDSAERRADHVVLVQNFFDELRRLVPEAKP